MRCFVILSLLVSFAAKSQTNAPDFVIADEDKLCINSLVKIDDVTPGFTSYYWDYCGEDFTEIPQSSTHLITGFAQGHGYKLIHDDDRWFGFFVSRSLNKLFRFDFGAELSSVPQSVSDLGNPGGLFSAPEGLDFFKEGDQWYAFVGKGENSSGQVVRLSFGTSLTNEPAADGFGTFGLGSVRIRDLRIVKQDDSIILLLLVYNSSSINRIDFGNSILNTPAANNVVPISGASLPRGLELVHKSDPWILHVVSENGKVQQISFEDNILGPVTVQGTFTFVSVVQPWRVRNVYSAGRYFSIISNNNRKYSIIDFGDLSLSTAPQEIEISNDVRLVGLDVVKFGGKTIIQGVGLSSTLATVEYAKDCSISRQYDESQNPEALLYSLPGDHSIDLTVVSDDGYSYNVSRELQILDFQAPPIEFAVDGVCANHNTSLTITQPSGVLGWNWDLGDGSFATDQNPSVTYDAPGLYNVSLRINNGTCVNGASTNVQIYEAPIADFLMPTEAVICTNNQMLFSTALNDNFDGYLTYQWYVDNALAGSDRDLNYAFTTPGPKEIKLITSIPGCSDEEIKSIPEVFAGPLINFSFEGQCATEEISFTTEVSEPVTDHFWSFDDGTSSTDVHPTHQFDFSGTYQVSLTATSPNGCNNSSTKDITIFSKPTPDFSIALPPLACNGVATPFFDLTPDPLDSDIVSWVWHFGESEGSASTQDAEFTFPNAADYNVSLTVATDAGCEESVSKSITIYPSPVAAITNTSSCLDKPTTFMATGNDIQSYYWEIGTSYYEENEITHTFQTTGDHSLMLTVFGNNDCVTTLHQTVNVPEALMPDFSFTNQCVEFETTFTDITADEHDPVTTREWNFAGTLVDDASSPTHVFNAVGEQNVSLTVTTEAGCIYSRTKKVNVLPAPVASFTASPEAGAAPLEVQFTNTSTDATEWLWIYNDETGTTSSEQSPSHTFAEVGDYSVELLARNVAGCESRFEKTFNVVTPRPDVNVKLISTPENPDGSIKVIVTLENTGNTFIRNLPLEIDISGNTSLTETVEGPIAPGSLYNLVLSYSINRANNLSFLCADAFLEDDLAPSGNRMCIQFEKSLFIFHPYPNPAADFVRVEWLSPAESEITIQVADSFGKTLLYEKVAAAVGLNRHQIDVTALRPGIYFIILKEKGTAKAHRIVISGQN